MRWVLPSLLVLVGCGSSWQIRKDAELRVGCPERYFYPDADGDGWGDASAEPVASCEAIQDQDLTASNGRDCDDGDKNITGRVGAMCPDGLLATDSVIDFAGVVFDQQEFVYIHGGSPVARDAMGTASCEKWSGSDFVEDVWAPRGSLSTFSSQAELNAVQDAIETSAEAGSGVFAGLVGIGWDGDLASGNWSWIDDASDSLIDLIPWCNGEPMPEDFFPNLNPNDPEHLPGIEAELADLRLALVLQENGSWCLGMPVDAIPADIRDQLEDGTADLTDPLVAELARYTERDGHLVCERPKPDPANYQEYTSVDAE